MVRAGTAPSAGHAQAAVVLRLAMRSASAEPWICLDEGREPTVGGMDQRGGAAPGAQAMINGGVAPPVTKIEQRGIEYVPLDHRWGKPASLFWMWAGAVWNVEFVLYGALAVLIFG